jgi:UDP:flavonoid glycosyltransferase YjiC (YdhE family)
MRRIAFAWEFGGGLGHIQYDLPLAKKLQERGHEVFCIMKHVINAEKILGQHGIKVLQAPVWQVKVKNRIESTFSYADTLYNQGYLIDGGLQSMVSAWRCLFESLKPDLLIVDHAPTAIVAARGTGLKVALYGTGFFAPPLQSPMPSILPWIKAPEGTIEQSEQRAVEAINAVLEEVKAPILKSLADLFSVDENFLATFKELDHYQDREEAKYWGPVINLPEGESPDWPASQFPKKIFCYIKSFYPYLDELLRSLQEIQASTIVFMPNAPKKFIEKYSSENLKFVLRPLNMEEVCRDCDLVVCHAGHGTIAVTLLHGKPMVLLPEHGQLEQILIGRHVYKGKLAEMVLTRQKERDYKEKIEKVLSDPQFTEHAKDFSEKYSDFDSQKQIDEIADRCEELISSA